MNKTNTARLMTGLMCLLLSLDIHAALITFDGLGAPSRFENGGPLREAYAALGVHFQGDGVVLDSVSNFEGAPLSDAFGPSNFLAFKRAPGGIPLEMVSFDSPIHFFKWDFAGSAGHATLAAYLDDTLMGTSSVATSFNAWNEMTLSAWAFNKVVFSVNNMDPYFVVDNLRYLPLNPPLAVPLPSSLWLLSSVVVAFVAIGGRHVGPAARGR